MSVNSNFAVLCPSASRPFWVNVLAHFSYFSAVVVCRTHPLLFLFFQGFCAIFFPLDQFKEFLLTSAPLLWVLTSAAFWSQAIPDEKELKNVTDALKRSMKVGERGRCCDIIWVGHDDGDDIYILIYACTVYVYTVYYTDCSILRQSLCSISHFHNQNTIINKNVWLKKSALTLRPIRPMLFTAKPSSRWWWLWPWSNWTLGWETKIQSPWSYTRRLKSNMYAMATLGGGFKYFSLFLPLLGKDSHFD